MKRILGRGWVAGALLLATAGPVVLWPGLTTPGASAQLPALEPPPAVPPEWQQQLAPPTPGKLLRQALDQIDLRRTLVISGGAIASIAVVNVAINAPLTADLMAAAGRRLLLIGAAWTGSRGAGWLYDLVTTGSLSGGSPPDGDRVPNRGAGY